MFPRRGNGGRQDGACLVGDRHCGPFMNMPWDWFTAAEKVRTVPACHEAVQKALKRREDAPPILRALIDALAQRFPSAQVPMEVDGLAVWERAYADAMATVYDSGGDDPGVAALYVES